MRHIIVNKNIDIPEGFDTYSVLLIPDDEWFESASLSDRMKFMNRFASFGELIGERNLSCWFYDAWIGSAERTTDVQVVAAIAAHIADKDELEKKIKNDAQVRDDCHMSGGYDTARARLICSALDLPYQEGPYIAFFNSHPRLPYFKQCNDINCNIPQSDRKTGPGHFHIKNSDNVTVPKFVLKFGGLDRKDSLALLDKLEQQVLTSSVSGSRLKWEESWIRIGAWCKKNRDVISKVISDIVVKAVV